MNNITSNNAFVSSLVSIAMKNKKHLFTILFLGVFQLGFSQLSGGIVGPRTVDANSRHTYSFVGNLFTSNTNWSASGGVLISTSQSSNTYSAVIEWGDGDSPAHVNFSYYSGKKGHVLESKSVTVEMLTEPDMPLNFSDKNYIHTIAPQIETTSVSDLQAAQKIESITYYDGLGRPEQSIVKNAGGNGEDVVTPVVYDAFGRQTLEYLPYAMNATLLAYQEQDAAFFSDLNNQYLSKIPRRFYYGNYKPI